MTGCSPANQAALTLDSASGRPGIVLELCEQERVTSVTLSQARVDEVIYEVGQELWRIQSASPTRQTTRYVVGEVPPGFSETRPFDPASLDGDLHLSVEVSGGVAAAHGEVFRIADLRPGVLMRFGKLATKDDLRRAAQANCSSNLFVQLGLPSWTWIPVLVVGLATGIVASLIAFLVWKSGVRRKNRSTAVTA